MTFIALIVVGLLQSFVTETSKLRGIINTVAPGGIVALIAYYVGDLEGIIQAF
jgi:VIT1/CCC1 family predicted Fe2+/Mn2+ transporter